MRDCTSLIKYLKRKHPDVINYIKELTNRKENDVFVGIRDEELTLYYRNAKVVTLSRDGTLKLISHKKYIGKECDKNYVSITYDYLKNHFEDILNNIDATNPKEENKINKKEVKEK